MRITNILTSNLYKKANLLTFLLLPLSFLFYSIVLCRRSLYRLGVLKKTRLPVPVIVVGNIAVGGTGKTPLVIYLAKFLKQQGFKVGIVRRGYGAKNITSPRFVLPASSAIDVGDESIMIARQVDCPVVVSPDRVAAAHALLSKYPCDCIISDDGLQHYALARDIEIVVFDGKRREGSGFCLPAGPLREPMSRLKTVDYVIYNMTNIANPILNSRETEYCMQFKPGTFTSVQDGTKQIGLEGIKDAKIIHAVAGIGNPDRFFETLRQLGLSFCSHVFPDHYAFKKQDINFEPDSFVIMTEKDAVKCESFADDRHWYLPVEVFVEAAFKSSLVDKLKYLIK